MLDIEELQDHQPGLIVQRAPRPSSTSILAASTTVYAAASTTLPVSIASTPAARGEKRARRREQHRLFEDFLPDAFPASVERYEEPLAGTSPTVK